MVIESTCTLRHSNWANTSIPQSSTLPAVYSGRNDQNKKILFDLRSVQCYSNATRLLIGFPKPLVVALNCEVESRLSKVWIGCCALGHGVAVVWPSLF